MIREITSLHETALYVHYSGVWDRRSIVLHPEWARIAANGKPWDLMGWSFAFDRNTKFRSPKSTVQNFGEGKIASVFVNLGRSYITQRISLAADFLDDIVRQVFPTPMLSVEGSGFVHVNLNKNKNNTNVHLMNTAGEHDNANVGQIDEIRPPYNLLLGLLLANKPREIILQPENRVLDFHWKDGKACMNIPRLEYILLSKCFRDVFNHTY